MSSLKSIVAIHFVDHRLQLVELGRALAVIVLHQIFCHHAIDTWINRCIQIAFPHPVGYIYI
jgi:hypothetical protein